jgi:hypothetical protein
MIRLVAALLALAASGTAWSQLIVSPLTNPPPDEAFDVLATASYPDPGTFNPQITIADDGTTVTVDLHASCTSSCPAATPSTRTFTMPPLAAGTYSITVYLDQCCSPVTGRLQLMLGDQQQSTQSYQGLWLDPAEPGWGLSLVHQGTVVFGNWFTYASDGTATWLMVGNAPQVGPGRFTGALYRTRGPAFNAVPFAPIGLGDYTQAGTMTLSFSDGDNGTVTYTLDGVTQSKPIVRHVFGTSGATCALADSSGDVVNFTDLWVANPQGSETGWGLHLVHQDNVLFATWFTYRADGKGQWLVMSRLEETAPGVYAGTLQRTTGPSFSAVPFDPARVKRSTVGSATITFSDPENLTFNYTLDGITQGKPIVRYRYTSPISVCQ